MKTAEVRAAFLKYFEERGHRIVPSDSLVPSTDPTLLFTSAGMVQFKPHFQNPSASPFRRAVSCQKCLRTSDIERVGATLRHLTFFEMLGNFSFGDYFKKESIVWGWEFLTRTMGLPGDRFVVSVFKEDDDAFAIWEKLVPKARIHRLDEDTNFWTMGPTGPCGPCSEILWDRGAEWSCGKPACGPACDCDRYLEVWNHVFTQFDRSADGQLQPLPQKNIDTGMGLERLSLLLQGADHPFGTDLFQAVMKDLSAIAGRPLPAPRKGFYAPTLEEASYRRIADHARAVAFMISDGILPSNEGRGYVLRRLLRQAVRAGKTLGIVDPFVYRLTGTVIDLMKDGYPETDQRRETIASVVKMEEEKFLETLDTGTRMLEGVVRQAKSKGMTTLPGQELFQLYDTYGFPFELTKEMAEGMGLAVDAQGFKKAQQQAVETARQAWKGSGAQDVERYRLWKTKLPSSSLFCGYQTLEGETTIPSPIAAAGGAFADTLQTGQEGEVVLPETPFYPEGGGQVGDTGWLEWMGGKADVLDTQTPVEGLIVHRIRVTQGTLSAGARVRARVDPERRAAIMRHHTATHMAHKALREVLGPHVTQAGSLVAPERLRFDFHHQAPLTREERQRVEDIVNQKIMGDLMVHTCRMTKEEAQKVGAMALFGEKYGAEVRTVMVSKADDCKRANEAWSLELCGGTHVHATGQVGFFKILGQSAVSAGVRRLEAVAGLPALRAMQQMEHQLALAAESLKTTPEELIPRLSKLLARERQLEKELQAAQSSHLRSQFDEILRGAQSVGSIRFVACRLGGVGDKQLREVADRLRDSGRLDLALVAAADEEKVGFVVSVRRDMRHLNAGQVAKEFAALIEGSGGGRPDFAQGGGKNVALLDGALGQVETLIKRLAVRTPHKAE